MRKLGLERVKEAFHWGIIPADRVFYIPLGHSFKVMGSLLKIVFLKFY